MLRSVIDSVGLNLILPMLLVVDQGKHKSTIPCLDHDRPEFYWIFRNLDFKQWSDASSQVLWLSGPPACSIHKVSSYVVDLENRALKTQRSVLYFFCETAREEESIVVAFAHTLLSQTIYYSPMDKKILMARVFLHTLVEKIFERKEPLQFENEGAPDTKIKKILGASLPNELWAALKAVLDEQELELLIIVDGLDKVKHQRGEFINEVREFIEDLLERKPKVKALLTSRPQVEIKKVLDGLPCIEYDKERKGQSVPYILL
jgi:hypothetical protein